ncbi:MAG: hypothetical protein J5943_08670 [Oribacterium sp.]|nr:hypothetical protein [Oribacterium sp.]
MKRYIRPEAVQRREIGIEAGKDADFLVFDKDLLTAEKEGFSHNMPRDVYFCGKKFIKHQILADYDASWQYSRGRR